MSNVKFFYTANILFTIIISFFNPILYIYLLSKQFSFTEVGLYLTFFWIVSFLTEIPCGAITDNIGGKNSLILSLVLKIVGLAMMFSGKLYIIYISAILSAISESFQSGTLSSWIVNVGKKYDMNINIDKVFSRSSLYSLFFSLVIGFISAKYLYEFDKNLPIIFSIIICFISLIVIVIFMKELEEIHKISIEKLKGSFITVKKSLKEILYIKSSLYLMLIFLLPQIIDLGPSNQWQAVFENLDASIIGYVWIGISLSGMLGSIVYEKFSNAFSKLKMLYILIVVNILLLLLFIFSINLYVKFVLFMFYIFIFTLIGIQINIFMHKYLVKSDENRTTTVSVFYTFESILVAILLSINGYLTDLVGISKTWLIFLIVVLIISTLSAIKLKLTTERENN